MSLAENLKRIRKERHISQEELAEELNVSRQAVSKWEQGICLPEAKMLLLISEKLDVSLDDLMSASTPVSDEEDRPPVRGEDKRAPHPHKIRLFIAGAVLIAAFCYRGAVSNPVGERDADAGAVMAADAERLQGDTSVFTSHEDRARIFELSCEFADAYFAQDFDSIAALLSPDFTGNPKAVSPWTGIDAYMVKGVDSISSEKADGKKVVSVEFRNPDYPDTFWYITIEFIKRDEDWKIHAYFLEG